MKYRHSFHAGNFADVHKHTVLLALLAALKRKDKGFFYLETHAGRGAYELDAPTAGHALDHEGDRGIERFVAGEYRADELRAYAHAVAEFRAHRHDSRVYPGSPLLAASALRAQDRAVAVEIAPSEARALERSLGHHAHLRVECGDGFERLRAHLPPAERRGLTFIDPPYEETQDLERVSGAIAEALRRFGTGVITAWYPIKEEHETAAWHAELGRTIGRDAIFSELWLYPRDSRVGLNGSGLVIVNPPYQIAERMELWLPELHAALDMAGTGGTSVRTGA